MRRFFNFLGRLSFVRRQEGVAAIEFAFMAPLLILLCLGSIEVSNYVYMKKKTENAAYNVLNILTQLQNISINQLTSVVGIVPHVMLPFPTSNSDYYLVITSIQRDIDSKDSTGQQKPYVHWQHVFGNSGLGTSRFTYRRSGSSADNMIKDASLGNFQFVAGDQVLTIESYFTYRPLIGDAAKTLLGSVGSTFSNIITARPRKGAFQFKPEDAI